MALSEGVHTLNATVTVPGQNESAPARFTLEVDTTAPGMGAIVEIRDDVGEYQGNIESGTATDDNTPTLVGTAEPNAVVIIRNGETVIGSTVANADGDWIFTPENPLVDGTYDFNIVVRDAAGNESDPSDPWTVIVDTVAPEQPVIGDIWDNTDPSNLVPIGEDGSTKDTTPVIGGVGEPGSTIIVIIDDEEVGTTIVGEDGRWTFEPEEPLAEGEHKIEVVERDPAGNSSEKSDPVTVIVDTTDRWDFNTDGDLEGWVLQGHYATYANINGNSQVRDGAFHATTPGSLWGTPNSGWSGNVMSREIAVVAGETYDFSMLFRTEAFNGDVGIESAKLRLFIDGNPIGPLFDSQNNPNLSVIATGDYTAINTGTVTLSIVNYADGYWGNDFLIDWITMTPQGNTMEANAPEFGQDDVAMPDLVADLANVFAVEEVEQLQNGLNGGDGIDTMKLTGTDQMLDLRLLNGKLESIEVIDITGTGDNTLKLSLGDVLELGEKDLFVNDGKTQMMVKGDVGDAVQLSDLLLDGSDVGDWAQQAGTVTVEGVTYNVYQHSGLDVELLVQQGVTTHLV
ncbi:hemolysin-type calcium-binding region [Burkholderia lata]|nr:hemolysin-type calcium-binding region [Burkholderia lata]